MGDERGSVEKDGGAKAVLMGNVIEKTRHLGRVPPEAWRPTQDHRRGHGGGGKNVEAAQDARP